MRKAFTLIEGLAVAAIFVIIAAIVAEALMNS